MTRSSYKPFQVNDLSPDELALYTTDASNIKPGDILEAIGEAHMVYAGGNDTPNRDWRTKMTVRWARADRIMLTAGSGHNHRCVFLSRTVFEDGSFSWGTSTKRTRATEVRFRVSGRSSKWLATQDYFLANIKKHKFTADEAAVLRDLGREVPAANIKDNN